MKKKVICPKCGEPYLRYCNPSPTVDVVIHDAKLGIVMVKRRNEPYGYALPGGFVEEGEQAEAAAVREMKEETGLDVILDGLLGVYSTPHRDPRQHTLGTVFVGHAIDSKALRAGDDAADACFYQLDSLPEPIVFDHRRIIADFRKVLAGKRNLAPTEPPEELLKD